MSDPTSDLSLNGEFVAAQRLHAQLQDSSLSSMDEAYQRDVRTALTHLENAADLVRRIGLFSTNEIVEDISTGDLKFLLVESYLGDMTTRLVNGDRAQILKTAKSYLEQFLTNCDMHDILRGEDKARLERIKEGGATRSGDPASARAQKIAQFKREKATKAKIEELERHLAQTDARSAPYSSAELGDVEDADREFVLALIDLHVLKALDQLVLVAQEEQMLEEAKKMREGAGRAEAATRVDAAAADARLDQGLRQGRASGPLLSKEGRPLRPFVITNQREQIQQQVFRPGWTLPTMTVDEYLQQEKERGNIISGGGQSERPEKVVPDDNDEAAINEETYKQREWDEFKEANPRGWGNRKGKG